MIPDFEYLAPKTVDEALSLLAEHEDAKIIAGGQSLLVVLKQRLLEPEYLIDIKGISELDYIKNGNGKGLRIGALTPHRSIEKSPVIQKNFRVLSEMENNLATIQTRNWGTVGGNLCHGDPAGDIAPILIAMGARLKLRSSNGDRTIDVEEFTKDYLEVDLEHGELLTEIQIPAPPPRTGFGQLKLMVMKGDMGIVGCAASITLDSKGKCENARIALSNAASKPLRAKEAERVLIGKTLSDKVLAEAGEAASAESNPPSDVHGTAAYRREMVKVFVTRAARTALQRAQTA